MSLVLITQIYHDAQSTECQTCACVELYVVRDLLETQRVGHVVEIFTTFVQRVGS